MTLKLNQKLKYEQTKGIYNNSAWCFVNSAIQFLYSCDEIRNYILNTDFNIIEQNYKNKPHDSFEDVNLNVNKLRMLRDLFEKLNKPIQNKDEFLDDDKCLEDKKIIMTDVKYHDDHPKFDGKSNTINSGDTDAVLRIFLSILDNIFNQFKILEIKWYEGDNGNKIIHSINELNLVHINTVNHLNFDDLKYNYFENRNQIEKFFDESNKDFLKSNASIVQGVITNDGRKNIYENNFINLNNTKNINFIIIQKKSILDSVYQLSHIEFNEEEIFFGKIYSLKSFLSTHDGGGHFWIKTKINGNWIELNDEKKIDTSIKDTDYYKWVYLLYEIDKTKIYNELLFNLIINQNFDLLIINKLLNSIK